jgi:uncharacterized protein YegJ (DUF2314 family)
MYKVSIGILAVALMCAGCGKSTDDQVMLVGDEDKAMNAAMAHAQSTVGEFLARFENPQPTDSDFSVKKPVQDGTQVEHFWLSDISYANGVFTGLIGNDPEMVGNVLFGQQVTVGDREISDWMYFDNGKMVGNFTLRVLLERMPKSQADAIREEFGIRD